MASLIPKHSAATDGDVKDEKYDGSVVEPVKTIVRDWTDAEEDAVKRKLDFVLIPILGLAFFALQMDRGNISNALTDTIATDLDINTNNVNVGNSLLSLGIVLLEVPSNILLQRIGPHKWLSGQIVTFGLVAALQSLVHNYSGFLATRIFLGFAESGFIPGALYTLSTWYKKGESNLRISLFFLGNLLANATASLIGAGILSMGPRYGIAGWRWLFIIEGCITMGIGIIFFCLLPPYPGKGQPWISFGRWSYFTPRQSHIITSRILLDDPAKLTGETVHISTSDVLTTLRNPRILMHVAISMSATVPVNAINTYGPSVIKSLGYDIVHANAMASVGHFISVLLVVSLGYVADRYGRKSPLVAMVPVWSIIAFACLRQSAIDGWDKGRRYAAVVFSMSTNSTAHILNVGWLSVNCKRPQERSMAMAMIIMAANAAGIAGSQVFRTPDAPLYVNAFTVCLTMAALVLVLVVFQGCWYFLSNKKLDAAASNTSAAAAGTGIEVGSGSGVEAGTGGSRSDATATDPILPASSSPVLVGDKAGGGVAATTHGKASSTTTAGTGAAATTIIDQDGREVVKEWRWIW